MSLPIFQDPNQNLMLLQTRWSSILNKQISNPVLNGIILEDISLLSGDNTINHLLGRNLQGFLVTTQNAAAQFYQKTSPKPELTFVLNSSAPVKVSLYVF